MIVIQEQALECKKVPRTTNQLHNPVNCEHLKVLSFFTPVLQYITISLRLSKFCAHSVENWACHIYRHNSAHTRYVLPFLCY